MADNAPSALTNILGQLRADHDEVFSLLGRYEKETQPSVRKDLLARLCRALRLHCTLEAGVFMPAVANASGQFDLLEKTGADYAVVLGLINDMGGAGGESTRLPAMIVELEGFVREHIASAESEQGFFTQAHRLAVDWGAIEDEMTARRVALNETLDRSEEIGKN